LSPLMPITDVSLLLPKAFFSFAFAID